MNLYCRLPFGRLNSRTAEIVALAEALGRTPSSVSMKLCNFAAFDPTLQARAVKGLQGASAADRQMWEAFHQDWEGRTAESNAMLGRLARSVVEVDGAREEGVEDGDLVLAELGATMGDGRVGRAGTAE